MTKIKERTLRIFLVTAGLSVAGGLVGALCASAVIMAIAAIKGGPFVPAFFTIILRLSAGFGAVAGMVGAPIVGWGLLRRVPLGRAIAFTAAGTVIGAFAGQFAQPLSPHSRAVPGVLVGALIGFAAAGVLARFRATTPAGLPNDA